MLDYKAYETLFNTGDDAALVERYFDEGVVFTGGAREYRGHQAVLLFARHLDRHDERPAALVAALSF